MCGGRRGVKGRKERRVVGGRKQEGRKQRSKVRLRKGSEEKLGSKAECEAKEATALR